ncbi:sugar-binding domain-containing protein [Streptomyces sp. NPDC054833]
MELPDHGRVGGPELTERSITIGFDQPRRIPAVIHPADGAERAATIAAALKTGLFARIVIDTAVADCRLGRPGRASPARGCRGFGHRCHPIRLAGDGDHAICTAMTCRNPVPRPHPIGQYP